MIVKNYINKLYNETLFRNSFYIMFSTGTMALFGFIFWLIVAHLYSPSQVGIASILVSSMITISYIGLFGFNNTFIRFLPKSHNRDKHINTGLVIVTIGTFLVALCYVLLAPKFAPRLGLFKNHDLYDVLFVVFCIGASLNLLTDSIFISYRSAGFNLLCDGLFGGLIEIILPILLIAFGAFGIFTAQGLSTFVVMGISIIFLITKYSYTPRFKIDKEIIAEVFHYSLGNYIASILVILPTIVIPLIILNNLGSASAGFYYLAYMMANVLFSIAYAVSQSLFAEGSYEDRELLHLIKRALRLLLIIILPASLALAIIGPFVLDIFGKTYNQHGSEVIIVLACAGPIVAINVLENVVLSILKKLKPLIIISAIYAFSICFFAYSWSKKGLGWVAFSILLGNAISAICAFIYIIKIKLIGSTH